MELVAETEVQSGFMQLDAGLCQKKLAHHFQLQIHLIGMESLAVGFFEMIGQRAFADIESVRQFLPCKKSLGCGLNQAGDFLCQGGGAGQAFSLFLLFLKFAQQQVEQKRKLLLFQIRVCPALRNNFLKERPDARRILAMDQTGKAVRPSGGGPEAAEATMDASVFAVSSSDRGFT